MIGDKPVCVVCGLNSSQRTLEFLVEHKEFKGTVVNRAVPSFHGGPLEITLTVPLNYLKYVV